jgi:two-component system, OmpR family, response regulator
MQHSITIFLVDDDAVFLQLLKVEFAANTKYVVKTFASGELCLANIDQKPDVIILDFHLDGIEKGAMDGLQTLDKIKELYPKLPVIMLSSQDKIEVAVSCMHHGAFDYVVKSETAFLRIEKNIAAFLKMEKIEGQLNWYMDRI